MLQDRKAQKCRYLTTGRSGEVYNYVARGSLGLLLIRKQKRAYYKLSQKASCEHVVELVRKDDDEVMSI